MFDHLVSGKLTKQYEKSTNFDGIYRETWGYASAMLVFVGGYLARILFWNYRSHPRNHGFAGAGNFSSFGATTVSPGLLPWFSGNDGQHGTGKTKSNAHHVDGSGVREAVDSSWLIHKIYISWFLNRKYIISCFFTFLIPDVRVRHQKIFLVACNMRFIPFSHKNDQTKVETWVLKNIAWQTGNLSKSHGPPPFFLGGSGDGGHQVFLGLVVLYVRYRYFIANLRSFRIERRLSWAGGVPSEICSLTYPTWGSSENHRPKSALIYGGYVNSRGGKFAQPQMT